MTAGSCDAEPPPVQSFVWIQPSWCQSAAGRTGMRPNFANFRLVTDRFCSGNLRYGTTYMVNNPSHVRDKNFNYVGRRNPFVVSLSRDSVVFDCAFEICSELTTMRFPAETRPTVGNTPPRPSWGNTSLSCIPSTRKTSESNAVH